MPATSLSRCSSRTRRSATACFSLSDAQDIYAKPSLASFLLAAEAAKVVFRLLEADVPVTSSISTNRSQRTRRR